MMPLSMRFCRSLVGGSKNLRTFSFRKFCSASTNHFNFGSKENRQLAFQDIKEIVGKENFKVGASDLLNHKALGAYDNLPEAIVYASTTKEVQEIVKKCQQHKVPLIAAGACTSLEGHIDAPYGGILLNLSNMNKVLSVNDTDWDVRVEAGVTREQLNDETRHTGLFFPVDPGANASIGGMASTNASGTTTLKYGSMKENILGVTAVMSDGSIIKTGCRARKNSAGYDLTRLLIGSEGTLGIITELDVKLSLRPEGVTAVTCWFDSMDDAVQAILELVYTECPSRMELLDKETMKALDGYQGGSFAAAPTIFVEFDGKEVDLDDRARFIREILVDTHGGKDCKIATRTDERNELWKARHNAYWAIAAKYPGKEIFATDACVPVSNLAAALEETQNDTKELNINAPLFGHVGDGNYHTTVIFDPNDPQEKAAAMELVDRIAHTAVKFEGTMTGEHGIGVKKIKYMKYQFTPETINVMKQIKLSLDPNNILNPGKQLPL